MLPHEPKATNVAAEILSGPASERHNYVPQRPFVRKKLPNNPLIFSQFPTRPIQCASH
jgi:hypothetical protein